MVDSLCTTKEIKDFRDEQIKKQKCGRKEIYTNEVLSNIASNLGVSLVNKISPTYSEIQLSCGHDKIILNRYLLNNTVTPCQICYEESVKQKFDSYNLNYLAKLKYGEAKSSYEFRLATCKSCGYFIFAQPNRLSTIPKFCPNCYRLEVESYIDTENYSLLNKTNKDSIAIQCKSCLSIEEIQLSNLYRHGYSCPYCSGKIKPSNVYLFKITKENEQFLKIGKSNSPYLRSLSFTNDPNVHIQFVASSATKNSDSAYEFEKYLKEKYKLFNLPHERGKQVISSGYTELYSIDILGDLILTMQNYGGLLDN